MQRITPAVALLIGTTSAAVGLMNSHANGQSPFPDPIGAWGKSSGNTESPISLATKVINDITITTNVNKLSCVDCVRSGQVWCSVRYIAEITTGQYAGPMSLATKVLTNTAIAVDGAAAQDRGQCCYSNLALLQAADGPARVIIANKLTCGAAYSNDGGSTMEDMSTSAGADGSAIVTANPTATYYWCSDGTNNHSAQSTTPNVPIIVKPLGFSLTPGVEVITTGVNTEGDPRTEFWLIACRQRQDQCGVSAVPEPAITQLHKTGADYATAQQRPVLLPGSSGVDAPTFLDKCSWIYKTKTAAPTFSISKTGTADVLFGSKWALHYVEYSTNADYGMTHEASFVFKMSADFGRLSGRYYDLTMHDGYQAYGDVWQWADETKNAAAGVAKEAKRWFPIAVVEEQIATYRTMIDNVYTPALNTFNAAAKKYNDVTKAKKTYDANTDVFKAAEKHDIPTRPAPPTRLAVYGGLRVAPWASVKTWTHRNGAFSQLSLVKQQDVIIDGSHSGGWGSFTAGLLPHVTEVAGHSFGCFGWSEEATAKDPDALKRSYVQSLLDMCGDTAGTAYSQCAPTGAVATSNWSVVIVSIWANDVTAIKFKAGASPAGSLTVSFGLNQWAQKLGSTGAMQWAEPTQPAPPNALEAPAGAKFLAASATAAIAVAAALY